MFMLICLEPVVVGIEFDKEAVGKDSHARDDTKDGVSYGLFNQEAVCDVGGIGKVELESWWVDKGNLRSPDLRFILVFFGGRLNGNMALTNGMTFVSGQSKTVSLPFRWTFSIP